MKRALFLMVAVATVCAGAASQIASTQSPGARALHSGDPAIDLRSDDRERRHAFADTGRAADARAALLAGPARRHSRPPAG